MSITVQNVIDRATERSSLNDDNLIPDQESRAYISNFERRVYMIAARENPDFFGREGNTATRGSSTASWNLRSSPGNVAAVSRLEVNAITGDVSGVSMGDEVNIISIRDPHQELDPRVYLRDGKLFEYNDSLQDDSSNYVNQLKVWYSFLPPVRTSNSDTLDLPDEWEDLVVIPLARHFAIRDQRRNEAEALDAEYQAILNLFTRQVSVFDEGTTRSMRGTAASSVVNFGRAGGQNG